MATKLSTEVDALRARHAALPAELETVKVKPLEWSEYKALGNGRKLCAFDCFGREIARLDLVDQSDAEIADFKKRNQRAYERSILSALIHPAPTHEDGSGGTAAGYRILGPDDVDPVTVERCATLAYVKAVEHCSARDGQTYIGHPVGQGIAAAIRALLKGPRK